MVVMVGCCGASAKLYHSVGALGTYALKENHGQQQQQQQLPHPSLPLHPPQIIDGKSERGDHPVVRMPLRQWTLKITKYADQLEAGLKGLDWPEGTLTAQKQWIGRSEGARWV